MAPAWPRCEPQYVPTCLWWQQAVQVSRLETFASHTPTEQLHNDASQQQQQAANALIATTRNSITSWKVGPQLNGVINNVAPGSVNGAAHA